MSEGVTAIVRGDGEPYEIRADYLIAADGHRSPVRETLGITRGGRGYLHTSRSVLFRAPLQEYLKDGIGQFVVDGVGFLTTYGDGRWVLMLDDREYDRARTAAEDRPGHRPRRPGRRDHHDRSLDDQRGGRGPVLGGPDLPGGRRRAHVAAEPRRVRGERRHRGRAQPGLEARRRADRRVTTVPAGHLRRGTAPGRNPVPPADLRAQRRPQPRRRAGGRAADRQQRDALRRPLPLERGARRGPGPAARATPRAVERPAGHAGPTRVDRSRESPLWISSNGAGCSSRTTRSGRRRRTTSASGTNGSSNWTSSGCPRRVLRWCGPTATSRGGRRNSRTTRPKH